MNTNKEVEFHISHRYSYFISLSYHILVFLAISFLFYGANVNVNVMCDKFTTVLRYICYLYCFMLYIHIYISSTFISKFIYFIFVLLYTILILNKTN